MQIPSVAFIEMALDQIKNQDMNIINNQLKEFRTLGNRISNFPRSEEVSELEYGYLIGLETARVLLSTMPSAIQHDIEI